MLGQIIIGPIRNTPQLAPTKGEQKLNIGSTFAVKAKFFRRVIPKTHFFLFDAQTQ